MSTKWLGAAAWSAREAHAGDRLPYARLVDPQTLLLRDGALMGALQVPGLLFETEDTDALNQHALTREVLLRSNLDARFVLYHHVIRRKVAVELAAQFDDPLAAHIDRRWRGKLASGSLFVNDQFVTLVRRPARGKAGLAEKAGRLFRRRGGERIEADPTELRSLRAALQALAASLGEYGAQPLGDYQGPSGTTNNELLELLSALYNGEMRPVRRPDETADVGRLVGPAHRAHLAVVERREQLEQLVVGRPARALVVAERLRAVLSERGGERLQRGAQAAQLGRVGLDPLAPAAAEQPAGLLGESRLAARRAAHQGHELVVDEQRAARQLAPPAPVDMRRERIVELRGQLDRDLAADHVMIEHEARVEVGAQQNLAGQRVLVERVGVLGLEQQPGHLQRAHQRAVAQQQRLRVDEAGVGQAVAGVRFPGAPRGGSEPLGTHSVAPLPPQTSRVMRRSCCSPSASNCAPGGIC